MSNVLRCILIIGCICTFIYISRKIKKSKFKVEESLYWISFVAILLLISIFPQILNPVTEILGFQAPINCVYVIIIFLLLVKVFLLSRRLSDLEDKMCKLVQNIAINENINTSEEEKNV